MRTLHVGTYENSGGRGLVPVEIGADRTLTLGEPFAGAPNASFGARGKGLVYLVDEQDDGGITVLRAAGGRWERVGRFPTGGAAPCYLALDRDCTRLAVANYASGSVALYALDGSGRPIGQPALFQARGSGPDAERQEGPHAHCVRFSHGSEAVYVVDLGADRVLCLKLGRAMFVEELTAWRAPPGTGPRHLLFHPRRTLAVVLSELSHSLTLLEAGDGRLRPIQSLSTAPAEFRGDNLGGHLALNADGTRVYASNRGHDSLAVFALENNRLELVQHVASGGAHPRHFVLLEDARLLAVAHEKDGRVGLFEIRADGTLAPTGRGAVVPGACFLLE